MKKYRRILNINKNKLNRYTISKKKGISAKKKNKIYFSTKNLKTIRLSQKLDHKKIRSFFIKKQKDKFNYKLNLPKEIRIYPIFYIFLLKSANQKIPISIKPSKLLPENEYKIKKIIDYNYKNQQYFIKWKKYNKKKYIGTKKKPYKL